jgi:hypothetical protein
MTKYGFLAIAAAAGIGMGFSAYNSCEANKPSPPKQEIAREKEQHPATPPNPLLNINKLDSRIKELTCQRSGTEEKTEYVFKLDGDRVAYVYTIEKAKTTLFSFRPTGQWSPRPVEYIDTDGDNIVDRIDTYKTNEISQKGHRISILLRKNINEDDLEKKILFEKADVILKELAERSRKY